MQYLYLFFLLCFSSLVYSREVGDVADFIFADLYIDKQLFPEGTELITPDYDHYFISQANLNTLLTSELTIDFSSKKVSGQLWGETVNFSVDEESIVTLDGEPHIRTDQLSQLNIASTFNARTQVLIVDTQQRHPKSLEKKREERKLILTAMNKKRANQVVLKDQYQWYTAPYVDVQLSASQSKHNTNSTAYVTINQDLAHHQANIVLTESNQDQLNGKLLLTRELSDKIEYQVGDLQGISGVLLDSSGGGLGIQYGTQHSATGKPLIIEGHAEPGSDVELYRNDALFDLVRVNDSGQYRFRPLQIYNSEHSYHLMIQHPDGRRERREVMTQAKSGYNAGQWYPTLTAYTTKASVLRKTRFNPEEKYINPQFNYVLTDQDEINFGKEWLHNLRKKKSLYYLGWERIGQPGKAKWHVKAGKDEHWYYDFKWLKPLSEVHNVSLSAQKGVGLFGSEKINTLSYELNLSDWQASSSFGLSRINKVQFKSLDTYLSYRSGSGSLAGSFGHIEGGDSREQSYSLIGSLSGNWGRARLNWNKTQGLFELNTLALSYAHQFAGYYGTLQLRRSLSERRNVSSLTLSKTFDSLAISANAAYHEASGWQFGLSCSFSFYGPSPLNTMTSQSARNNSALKIRAFYDRNSNQRFDASEPYLPHVTIMHNGNEADMLEQGDEKTLLYLPGNRPATLEIEHNEMGALYLQPEFGLIEANLHPGANQTLDIPFHLQFEAEGLIILMNKNGEEADISGRIPIALTRLTSGEKTVLYTEPDGFFFFDKLKQGAYHLEISPDYIEDKALTCDPCQLSFTLNEQSEQLVVLDDLRLIPNDIADPVH
ncbi:hypothetical protein CWB99_01435 [Pseudoalteromonas rubra]|uniref:Uncharacterized protein n=1 Tax=Pseudoalteromonas rubra TaxID=43658 RepID=A0A5S3WTM3_9GAMM|nr:hypothetical protein [Pseudoalteromonas rubra]TMP28122.1 hypothetical protein CWC00_22160 [Pseudoalteromonas rubra]TMP32786.1 hypothetical protein CWB99_01435 [Pseudoalteromonas rubra]